MPPQMSSFCRLHYITDPSGAPLVQYICRPAVCQPHWVCLTCFSLFPLFPSFPPSLFLFANRPISSGMNSFLGTDLALVLLGGNKKKEKKRNKQERKEKEKHGITVGRRAEPVTSFVPIPSRTLYFFYIAPVGFLISSTPPSLTDHNFGQTFSMVIRFPPSSFFLPSWPCGFFFRFCKKLSFARSPIFPTPVPRFPFPSRGLREHRPCPNRACGAHWFPGGGGGGGGLRNSERIQRPPRSLFPLLSRCQGTSISTGDPPWELVPAKHRGRPSSLCGANSFVLGTLPEWQHVFYFLSFRKVQQCSELVP